MMVDNSLPMFPPPPPTFRAPTRDSMLVTKGKRSSTVDEEDLSFMDKEVTRHQTERMRVQCGRNGVYLMRF